MKKARKTTTAPCSSCLKTTFHNILHSEEREIPRGWWPEDRQLLLETEPGEPDWKPDSFELIECAGCGRISHAHRYMDLVLSSHEPEVVLGELVDYYPSPVARQKPAWLLRRVMVDGIPGVPGDIASLFDEVYEAVRGGQFRLAIMGIRALLEQVMITKIGDRGSFVRNLEAAHKEGFLSLIQRNAMSSILDAGHAAIHRLHEPTSEDLATALDIAEGICATIFVHPDAATAVSGRVPPRRFLDSKRRAKVASSNVIHISNAKSED
jgi:hypothetical protein